MDENALGFDFLFINYSCRCMAVHGAFSQRSRGVWRAVGKAAARQRGLPGSVSCFLVAFFCHWISAQDSVVKFIMGWPKQVPNERALDDLVLRMVTARAPKAPLLSNFMWPSAQAFIFIVILVCFSRNFAAIKDSCPCHSLAAKPDSEMRGWVCFRGGLCG